MIEKIKDKEFLIKNVSLVNKLRTSPRALAQFVKIYNNLCPKCKVKVYNNSNIPFDEYCSKCQRMAKKKLEKVKQILQ